MEAIGQLIQIERVAIATNVRVGSAFKELATDLNLIEKVIYASKFDVSV